MKATCPVLQNPFAIISMTLMKMHMHLEEWSMPEKSNSGTVLLSDPFKSLSPMVQQCFPIPYRRGRARRRISIAVELTCPLDSHMPTAQQYLITPIQQLWFRRPQTSGTHHRHPDRSSNCSLGAETLSEKLASPEDGTSRQSRIVRDTWVVSAA